jgi:hypothetical protein
VPVYALYNYKLTLEAAECEKSNRPISLFLVGVNPVLVDIDLVDFMFLFFLRYKDQYVSMSSVNGDGGLRGGESFEPAGVMELHSVCQCTT